MDLRLGHTFSWSFFLSWQWIVSMNSIFSFVMDGHGSFVGSLFMVAYLLMDGSTSRLPEPNRWSNRLTPKTETGKKPDHKTGPPKIHKIFKF